MIKSWQWKWTDVLNKPELVWTPAFCQNQYVSEFIILVEVIISFD